MCTDNACCVAYFGFRPYALAAVKPVPVHIHIISYNTVYINLYLFPSSRSLATPFPCCLKPRRDILDHWILAVKQ